MPLAKQAFASVDAAALRNDLLSKGAAEIELNGDKLVLEPDDVEVLVESAGHYAAAGDRTTVVVLNTELNDQLREEGFYRELLHRVQNLRKELDIEYTQRIRLSIQGSERLRRILAANEEHFKAETLCIELRNDDGMWDGAQQKQFDIEGEEVTVSLAPA